MKIVTNEYKKAIVQPRRIDAKIIDDATTLTIDNINNITQTFNTSLFKTIMKMLIIDTNNKPLSNIVSPKFGIYVNGNFEYISLGNFKIISTEKNEDTLSYESKCYDKIIESMIDYDLNVTYPITVRNYWLAIYERLGWNTNGIPETFINSEKYINEDVHSKIGYTFRDVLDELCTISCAFLLDKNGIPTISYPCETNEIIDENYMADANVKVGNKVFFNSLVFSRAEMSDNIFRKDESSIELNGLKELKIINNQLLSTNDRADYIDEMWNYIKTFEYYSFNIQTKGITFIDPIDKFNIKIGENIYPTILLNDDLQICDGVKECIYSDDVEETTTDYKCAADTDKKINQTYFLLNKQKQEINILSNKIVDTTETKQGIGSITINSKLDNPGYKLVIKNACQLFPSKKIFPSNDLFPLGYWLRVTYEDDTYNRYKMPILSLRQLNNVYDELIITSGKVQIIKRIGTNEDGTLYLLDLPTVIEYEDINIVFKYGINKIQLESFPMANLELQYMIESIYSNTFSTKVETSAEIKMTTDEINLEVAKKTDKEEIINTINMSSEKTKIDVNKLDVDAIATFTNSKLKDAGSTVINGSNITTGDIKSANYVEDSSGTKINLADGSIDTKNFKVDENGNMTCSNATFTNGNIDTPNFKVDSSGSITMTDNPKNQTEANLYIISSKGKTYQSEAFYQSRGVFCYEGIEREGGAYLSVGGGVNPQVGVFKNYPDLSEYYVAMLNPKAILIQKSGKEGSQTVISPSGIETPTVSQTSLEIQKKNFEKFENGLDIINDVDIYKYHLKGQEDTEKKHIGFVIGDNYNYREEIISQNNNGVDLYSMISVAWQSIKELNQKIEQLEIKIKELESEKNEKN